MLNSHLDDRRPNPGPVWQDELLHRLRADPRFAVRLHGIRSWDLIPIMDTPGRIDPRTGFGYFSSSSTGTAKQVLFTPADWEEAAAHRADCLAALGMGPQHLVVVLLPFGPWFSGDNLSDALLRLGARVIPAGAYAPHLDGVARIIRALDANAVITTPSIAWALTEQGPFPRLEKLITVGERLSPRLRSILREGLGASPQALFAASEAILGYETGKDPDGFVWDPSRLHLEVRNSEGGIAARGRGELLVTRRYGEGFPLLRYPLGDLVELDPGENGRPCFRHLGRSGYAFGMAGGVKVGRAQLDRFLDSLDCPVYEAAFQVTQGPAGTRVRLTLGTKVPLPDTDRIRHRFLASSLDVADAHACGFVQVEVKVREVPLRAKRKLEIRESHRGS